MLPTLNHWLFYSLYVGPRSSLLTSTQNLSLIQNASTSLSPLHGESVPSTSSIIVLSLQGFLQSPKSKLASFLELTWYFILSLSSSTILGFGSRSHIPLTFFPSGLLTWRGMWQCPPQVIRGSLLNWLCHMYLQNITVSTWRCSSEAVVSSLRCECWWICRERTQCPKWRHCSWRLAERREGPACVHLIQPIGLWNLWGHRQGSWPTPSPWPTPNHNPKPKPNPTLKLNSKPNTQGNHIHTLYLLITLTLT